MAYAPEIILKEVIAKGITAYRKSPEALTDLFEHIDEQVQRMEDKYSVRLYKFLKAHPAIHVTVNWPKSDAVLPCVNVITESSVEPDEKNFLGRGAGLAPQFQDAHMFGGGEVNSQGLKPSFVSDVKASNSDEVFSVAVSSLDEVMTSLLSELVRHILLTADPRLWYRYGLQEGQYGVTDFTALEGFFLPRKVYSRAVSCKYLVERKFNTFKFSKDNNAEWWDWTRPVLSEVNTPRMCDGATKLQINAYLSELEDNDCEG